MKTHSKNLALAFLVFALTASARAQVNSGSTGADGAFNPTTNTVINMANHPDGIYHYSSVNIPAGVEVTFTPNVNNTPVVWLVQGNCSIAGIISLNGGVCGSSVGALSGPGGYRGGNKPAIREAGLGPGGGRVDPAKEFAGAASYGSLGSFNPFNQGPPPGDLYGNVFLVPLLGGSGGGGPGGGGGGAILIAASGTITVSGRIDANGGNGFSAIGFNTVTGGGGGGSGGAIRLVTTSVTGNGGLFAAGGQGLSGYSGGYFTGQAGSGRVRIDALSDTFSGSTGNAVATRGYQPIIIPPTNQAISLAIQSVAGVAVAASPAGSLVTPDVIIPGQLANPMPIVVRCGNIPLNTQIIVEVKPANGPTIQAVGLNNQGTQASSTATVSVTMPRGGGTIQAKAISGIQLSSIQSRGNKNQSYAQTGWTADGERFASVEITATLGHAPQLAYLTESGKRYSFTR